MSRRFEGHFRGYDQTELFFQTWQPERPRGMVLITHGLAEHSECYHELAESLGQDQWQVYAWDMRGHGRSDGKRGFVRSLLEFIDDLACFQTFVATQSAPNLPLILFGHSLGGLVTLRYAELKKPSFAAMALSSPAFGLSVSVPKVKETLAQIANRWLPTLTMHNEIKYEDLTRDAGRIETFRKDALRHDKISPGLFLGMVEHFPLALAQAAEVTQPILMQVGDADKIASTVAGQALFKRLPNAKNILKVYAGGYHELFNDLERTTVTQDLKSFIRPFQGA